MLKKTIKYTDFNEEEITEVYFFNLSKAELIELQMSRKEGFAESIQAIIDAGDGNSLIGEFKKLILMSYGKKSADGKRFIKNQQLRDEFESSEAYSTLFMELATDTDAAIEFINGIIPTGFREEAERLASGAKAPAEADPVATGYGGEESAVLTKFVTKAELEEMSAVDFAELRPKLSTGEVKIV